MKIDIAYSYVINIYIYAYSRKYAENIPSRIKMKTVIIDIMTNNNCHERVRNFL